MSRMTTDELKSAENLPRHVAIIMDGNGRWARQKGMPRIAGHREGINSVREIVEFCGELGIGYLTLYTFSEENWNRPQAEVSFLMNLLMETIRKEVEALHRNNVRVRVIGDIDKLPKKSREEFRECMDLTRDNTGLNLILALSYSSRNEIVNAARAIAADVAAGNVKADEISESTFSSYLYTNQIPDPDLLIRTSGEQRISNFLLWQVAYSEFYITPVLWPSFRKAEMIEALTDYLGRDRRFGKVND